MAIIELIDQINNAVEKRETTLALYLDLSKTFDTIEHNILLYKLEHYGFRGIVLDWFKSYLSIRTQYVYYNNCKSKKLDIICGVPQGSILGPLLFILYINDIVNTSNMLQFILFADDTTILFSDTDISNKVDLINTELKEVTNWFKSNKLSVNASKTNFMIMGTTHQTCKPQNSIKVILDNVELSLVNKTKFVGVLIDENLTWKDYIDAISKTMSRNVGTINKLKYFVPKRILLSSYYTLVMPQLNYGILAWGNSCKTYLNKLLKLQKRAVRQICKTSFRHSSIILFRDLRIFNVYITCVT